MERLMSKTVYDYMDWPEIEAVVYGEETAPRDVMGPRLTPDGVLIQGFFKDNDLIKTNYEFAGKVIRESLCK